MSISTYIAKKVLLNPRKSLVVTAILFCLTFLTTPILYVWAGQKMFSHHFSNLFIFAFELIALICCIITCGLFQLLYKTTNQQRTTQN